MIVVLSGEGPTDLGTSATGSDHAPFEDIQFGPLAEMIELLVASHLGYSLRDCGMYRLISESGLSARAKGLKALKKQSLTLPGRKKAKETAYFYTNARALAVITKKVASEVGCDAVAILFRDSDGTASAGRGEWTEKRDSMVNGFAAEGFRLGVPMLAKPKLEAWLICALRQNAYQNCNSLEDESGNDNSPNNLKDQLEAILGEPANRETLRQMVADGRIDPLKIEMPSFTDFKQRLQAVLLGRPEASKSPG